MTYQYDLNNRLQQEIKALGAETEVTEYRYDRNGDLVYQTTGISKSFEGETEYTGEFAKNQEFATASYHYDPFNRLTLVQEGTQTGVYTYNADGYRDSRKVNGETVSYVYDGGNIIKEGQQSYYRGLRLIADGS